MEFYRLTIDESVAAVIDHRLNLIKSRSHQEPATDIFAVVFDHIPFYLPDAKPVSLIALVCIHQAGEECRIEAGFLPALSEHLANLEDAAPDAPWLQAYVTSYQSAWLNLSSPLLLDPIHIPKPWGREIWYTGIEARGQSRVSDGRFTVPLPWVLEVVSLQEALTLLKILDPLPDESLGNLYFELHEEKQEVYIVTHVDPVAWSEGVGQIQLGFCQQKRREFASDVAFRMAYVQAVNDYKGVRRKIDHAIDQLQELSNQDRRIAYQHFAAVEANQPLIAQEREFREAMNAFIYHHPLRVGDVVRVPCYIPHSLQHGVRVVEFQTPVYERKILSFGQKVLTQDEWDTEAAMEIAHMDTAQGEEPELLSSSLDYQLERIVNFDDFQVQRLVVKKSFGVSLSVQSSALIMLVKGIAHFSSENKSLIKQTLMPGQAYLSTSKMPAHRLVAEADSLLLVAMPKGCKWSELA